MLPKEKKDIDRKSQPREGENPLGEKRDFKGTTIQPFSLRSRFQTR